MSRLIWPWLVVATTGLALLAWKLVLLCQAIALPFFVVGWAFGFRLSGPLHWTRPARVMGAGWAGLIVAEAGLALILWRGIGRGVLLPGLLAFPGLAVLVTAGVLWFYRRKTWVDFRLTKPGNAK